MYKHVHLLVTPQNAGDVGRLMQRLGTNYVGLFNARHARTGTLWEGRYKRSLVDSEVYVRRCHRFIELNPFPARLPEDPPTFLNRKSVVKGKSESVRLALVVRRIIKQKKKQNIHILNTKI